MKAVWAPQLSHTLRQCEQESRKGEEKQIYPKGNGKILQKGVLTFSETQEEYDFCSFIECNAYPKGEPVEPHGAGNCG